MSTMRHTITFRAAGSSLSGQCSSEDVLIVCNDGFKKMEVIDDGKALKCECGVIGSDANDLLKPYNRKIGPDPATLATALVGGILIITPLACAVVQRRTRIKQFALFASFY